MNGAAPTCGAQQPGTIPRPFDWWLLSGIAAAAAAVYWAYQNGVPLANQLIHLLSGTGPLVPGAGIASAFAGAAAILLLVAYYALQPDGCIVPKTKTEPICLAGIVEQTFDLRSNWVLVLAPFAVGPAGGFDVVVKSMYWHYTTQNAYWVYCSAVGAAMLRCLVESNIACGAKIGSLVGAAAGAIVGVALGYLAAASLSCGPFAWLCFLVALLIAAIVAAAITYAGAMVGGWIGAGIASAGGDPVGDVWEGLEAGAIVTVRGDWMTDPDLGNNQLYYTTRINRTGEFGRPPSYSAADADATATDDCELVPPPPVG